MNLSGNGYACLSPLTLPNHPNVDFKESLAEEIANTNDAVQRTQSRVVQSPERIKKRISQMALDTADDKRTIAAHEAKARDLQAKVNALAAIEKACVHPLHKVSC
jgi:kinetochore protein Nuf2